MRAVLVEVPEHFLQQRRRTGADRWDEMWEGVLHMVPPPSEPHQALGVYLVAALLPIAKAKGLELRYELGFFRADDDYRQPDLVVAAPEHLTRRGLEGPAALVVEILSPGDESRDKLGFYAAMRVGEVLLIDPETREFELLRLGDEGFAPVPASADGAVHSAALDVELSVAEGPILRVRSAASEQFA